MFPSTPPPPGFCLRLDPDASAGCLEVPTSPWPDIAFQLVTDLWSLGALVSTSTSTRVQGGEYLCLGTRTPAIAEWFVMIGDVVFRVGATLSGMIVPFAQPKLSCVHTDLTWRHSITGRWAI